MWPSKLAVHTAASLLALTGLTACSLGTPQERAGTSQEAATFLVDKTEVSVTSQISHSSISLPQAKVYSFKACLKETQYSKPVLNHEFEVAEATSNGPLTSDNSGCITWSEKIPYNHLAEAKWVEVVRSIRARGIQQGQRQIRFALNPWEDAGESLLNKKIPNVINAAKALETFNSSTRQGIWIDDIRLTIEEKKMTAEGVVLGIELRAQPSWSVLKTNNRRVLEPLTRGEFEAELILINVLTENGQLVRRPISAPVTVKGQIANNALVLGTDKVTLAPASRYGQIHLGLKLKALNGPESLSAFEGVFTINEYDQIKGNSFSRLKKDFQEKQGELKIEDYLTDKKVATAGPGSENEKFSSDRSQPSAYQKSQVQVLPLEFTHVGFKNKNSLNREKIFTVTACMVAPLDSKPLRAQMFDVQKSNGSGEQLRSNEKGCITWEDSISFEYLAPECWISKQIQISNSNFEMVQKFTIQANPWTDNHSSLRDTRHIGKQELTCAAGRPKIVLLHYEFDKKTIQYPIDSLLNIKVQKEGILKLQGRFKRPSLSHASGFEDEALPPGRYQLKWAIVDHNVQDLSKAKGLIYQVQEKTVDINASGTLSESLTLESANLRALGNTNYLILEIAPENATSHLLTATYRGPLVLSNNDESGNLELIQESENSLVSQLKIQFEKDHAEQQKIQMTLSQKSSFATSQNLALLNLSEEDSTLKFRSALGNPTAWFDTSGAFRGKEMAAVSTQDLQKWVQSGKLDSKMAAKLCSFWFMDQMRRPLASRGGKPVLPSLSAASTMNHYCHSQSSKNPKQFFDIQYRYFLKNAKKVKDVSTEIRDLTFNHAFSMSHAHDMTVSTTMSADVNGGFSTSKWFSPFSIGGGFRYQVAKADSVREGSVNAANIQNNETLQLEKLNFQIRAEGVEKCAVIRLNPEIISPSRTPLLKLTSPDFRNEKLAKEMSFGLMLCEGQIRKQPVNFTESYFILNQRTNYTQVIDSNSDLGRPLFMAVRGINDFRRLMQNMDGQMKSPATAEISTYRQHSLRSTLAPAFQLGFPTFPGQYVADE